MDKKLMASLLLTGVGIQSLGFAQDQAQIYGAIGVSITQKTNQGEGNKSVNELSNNILIPSFIGFRGSEDLGAGNKIVYRLEGGFAADTGGSSKPGADGLTWDRQSFVGFESSIGSITVGRQFHAMIDRVVRTVDINNAGTINLHTTPIGLNGVNRFDGFDNRVSNSIKYRMDKKSGLQYGLSYGFGEEAGSTKAGSSYSFDLAYIDEKYNLGAGYVRYNSKNKISEEDQYAKHETFVVGGSINYGVIRPYFGFYDASTQSVAIPNAPIHKSFISNIGVRWIPKQGLDFRVSYYHDKSKSINNVAGRDGVKETLVLVSQMALSRRTLINAVYSTNSLNNGYLSDPLTKTLLFSNPVSQSKSSNYYGIGLVHLF